MKRASKGGTVSVKTAARRAPHQPGRFRASELQAAIHTAAATVRAPAATEEQASPGLVALTFSRPDIKSTHRIEGDAFVLRMVDGRATFLTDEGKVAASIAHGSKGWEIAEAKGEWVLESLPF
jgi:hypothetical protein